MTHLSAILDAASLSLYSSVSNYRQFREIVKKMMSEEQVARAEENEVRIHIDEHQYESPNPTTGMALYKLGRVGLGLVLYREVTGDREDKVVPDGPERVRLKMDEHFHSGRPEEKEFTVIVNGRKNEVTTEHLSFDQVVALAFNPVPTGPNILFTITYRRGPRENPEGSLLEGQTVKIKDGMIFNVTQTDKS
jgi:hypothetical protein